MRDESRVQCGHPVAKETPKAARAVLIWVFPGRKWYSSRAQLCGWEVSEKWLSSDIRRADCANRPSLLPTSNGKNENTECGRQRSKVKTLLLQRCALRKFHVIDGQNMRDQITNDRRSKRTWSDCVLCIPLTLGGESIPKKLTVNYIHWGVVLGTLTRKHLESDWTGNPRGCEQNVASRV